MRIEELHPDMQRQFLADFEAYLKNFTEAEAKYANSFWWWNKWKAIRTMERLNKSFFEQWLK